MSQKNTLLFHSVSWHPLLLTNNQSNISQSMTSIKLLNNQSNISQPMTLIKSNVAQPIFLFHEMQPAPDESINIDLLRTKHYVFKPKQGPLIDTNFIITSPLSQPITPPTSDSESDEFKQMEIVLQTFKTKHSVSSYHPSPYEWHCNYCGKWNNGYKTHDCNCGENHGQIKSWYTTNSISLNEILNFMYSCACTGYYTPEQRNKFLEIIENEDEGCNWKLVIVQSEDWIKLIQLYMKNILCPAFIRYIGGEFAEHIPLDIFNTLITFIYIESEYFCVFLWLNPKREWNLPQDTAMILPRDSNYYKENETIKWYNKYIKYREFKQDNDDNNVQKKSKQTQNNNDNQFKLICSILAIVLMLYLYIL